MLNGQYFGLGEINYYRGVYGVMALHFHILINFRLFCWVSPHEDRNCRSCRLYFHYSLHSQLIAVFYTETADDLTLELCSGHCCEATVTNDGANLQKGISHEISEADLGLCEGFKLKKDSLTVKVTKPGTDRWWGEFIE